MHCVKDLCLSFEECFDLVRHCAQELYIIIVEDDEEIAEDTHVTKKNNNMDSLEEQNILLMVHSIEGLSLV